MHRFSPALALALLTFAVLPAAAASAADPVLDAEEKAFCKQINQYRAQNGQPALRVSVTLDQRHDIEDEALIAVSEELTELDAS